MKQNGRKLLIIGIDGATFRIISQLIKKKRLPNMARMMSEGVHGILKSTIPPISPVAWSSFMTGNIPARHQIFDFTGKIPATYKFKINNSTDRKSNPFWMNLSRRSKKVLILGVTLTYPPDPVNGIMISGLGTPANAQIQSYIYPSRFAEDIINLLGEYKVVPEAKYTKLFKSDREKDKYLINTFKQIEDRIKLFNYLWEKDNFDFSMIFFLDTDGISHYFWKYFDVNHDQYQPGPYSDAICEIYERIDTAIGNLTPIIKDEVDVMVVSDHGFGPLNRVIFLNNWLESKDYLNFEHLSPIETTAAKAMFFLPRHLQPFKKKIHWRKTKAFFNGTSGGIFINLKGREPEGIINHLQYHEICTQIKTELLQLEDPKTATLVVKNVHTRHDLKIDVNDPIAPDLVVTFTPGYDSVGDEIGLHALNDTGEIIVDSNNWSGTHEPEGIFMACGEIFKKGVMIENANIIDIAPTVLYLLGVPIPNSMDGAPLINAFSDQFLHSNPILYSENEEIVHSSTSEVEEVKDNQSLIKQLRALGYLD